MPFLEGTRILHFAPETIIRNILKNTGCDYFDADLFRDDVRCKEDITKLSFKDLTFDYIICIHVLEHIVDDYKAMSEMYRVLKVGGTAFLGVPLKKELVEDYSITNPKQREYLFGQDDHVRYYSLNVICNRLKKAGFSINISYPENFSEDFVNSTMINNNFIESGATIIIAKK